MENILPAKISAGLTFDRLVTLTEYPATSWALSVLLRGPSVINLAGVAEGSQFRINVPGATTSPWTAGGYSYSARVTLAGDVREVQTGRIEIIADLANVIAGTDVRSQNRRTLDAINAVLEKRASQDQQKYVINNRELWRTPIADLLKLRGVYVALVRAEDAAMRGQSLFRPALRVSF